VKNNKAFTLIELVLAITILLGIIGAVVINYDSMVGNSRYFEARENLKTYLINLKHQSAFQQKQFELTFDPDYNMYSSFEDFYLLDAVTNDLKILDTSATKIVFFLDGTVQESYIVTSNLEGTITNTFIINVIGSVNYEGNTNIVIEKKESDTESNYEQ
jgi:prepilin-type N-terminal cleavage/methylation domain-containing protein